ncbi:MAG: helix-turn-helix domain-containing protein [Candidatus Dojkabacteria bacterium]|nr:helix-turn-helix domain-containing protein [Candidatus Dojkabacteria bacterium]
MDLTKLLKQIGLRKTEIDVYKQCTDYFPRASEIANNTGLKRTNVYAILNSLIEKDLVVEVMQGKVKRFHAVSLSRLYDYVERQKMDLERNSQDLDRALETISKQFAITRHANVEFFNGLEEVKKLIQKTDSKRGQTEVKHITKFERYAVVGNIIDKVNASTENTYRKLGKNFVKEKTIVPDTTKSKSIIAFQTSKHPHYQKWRDFRFVDFKSFQIESQILLLENNVYLISITESETWALKFSDKSIFSTFDAIFQALWASGKKLAISKSTYDAKTYKSKDNERR